MFKIMDMNYLIVTSIIYMEIKNFILIINLLKKEKHLVLLL